jgi:hypothetical protein
MPRAVAPKMAAFAPMFAAAPVLAWLEQDDRQQEHVHRMGALPGRAHGRRPRIRSEWVAPEQ